LPIHHLDNIINIYDGLVEQNVLRNDDRQRSVIKNLHQLSEDIMKYKPRKPGFFDKVHNLHNTDKIYTIQLVCHVQFLS
jgi:predicted ATPase